MYREMQENVYVYAWVSYRTLSKLNAAMQRKIYSWWIGWELWHHDEKHGRGQDKKEWENK